MNASTRVGLAWGGVLLLVQLVLAGIVGPGIAQLGGHGRRASSDAVLGGVCLIVLGLALIATVICARSRHQPPAHQR